MKLIYDPALVAASVLKSEGHAKAAEIHLHLLGVEALPVIVRKDGSLSVRSKKGTFGVKPWMVRPAHEWETA